jgi:hypothetical protein
MPARARMAGSFSVPRRAHTAIRADLPAIGGRAVAVTEITLDALLVSLRC